MSSVSTDQKNAALRGIADAIEANGGRIFENSPVTNLQVDTAVEGEPGHGAIHHARIDETITEVAGQPRQLRNIENLDLAVRDVAVLQVSPPDAHGYCSLGTSIDAALTAAKHAKLAIEREEALAPGEPPIAVFFAREALARLAR